MLSSFSSDVNNWKTLIKSLALLHESHQNWTLSVDVYVPRTIKNVYLDQLCQKNFNTKLLCTKMS